MSRYLRAVALIFTVFVYFSSWAHDCEVPLIKVDGLRLQVRFTPVNNESLIINAGSPSRPLIVSRTGVDAVTLVDNRHLDLGVFARTEPIYSAPEGYTIQGARSRGSDLVLHLQGQGELLQRRNFLIVIEISKESYKVRRVNPWQLSREWHIEKFVKQNTPAGFWQQIESIRERIDRGSYQQRVGTYIFGDLSRYLGETTRGGFRYLYFARDHMLRITGPMTFDAIKREFEKANSQVTVVRVSANSSEPLYYVGAQVRGLVQIPYVYVSEESPLLFYIQRMITGSGYQNFQSPKGNQNLVQIDFQGLDWQVLEKSGG